MSISGLLVKWLGVLSSLRLFPDLKFHHSVGCRFLKFILQFCNWSTCSPTGKYMIFCPPPQVWMASSSWESRVRYHKFENTLKESKGCHRNSRCMSFPSYGQYAFFFPLISKGLFFKIVTRMQAPWSQGFFLLFSAVSFFKKPLRYNLKLNLRGTRVPQSVKHKTGDFDSGHDLMSFEVEPPIRLQVQWGGLLEVLSPSLPLSLILSKTNL